MLRNQNEEASLRVSKKQGMTKQIKRHKAVELKEVQTIQKQVEEVQEFKDCLLTELSNEAMLKDEI